MSADEQPLSCGCKLSDIDKEAVRKAKEAWQMTQAFELPADADPRHSHKPEYAGRICCNPKTGEVTSTGPIIGSWPGEKIQTGMDGNKAIYAYNTVPTAYPEEAPPCPDGCLHIRDYHSHPHRSEFSEGDKSSVRLSGRPLYLGVDAGVGVLEFTGRGERIVRIVQQGTLEVVRPELRTRIVIRWPEEK